MKNPSVATADISSVKFAYICKQVISHGLLMFHQLLAVQTSQSYRMAKYQVLALRKCTVEVRVVKQWFSNFHLLHSKLHLE